MPVNLLGREKLVREMVEDPYWRRWLRKRSWENDPMNCWCIACERVVGWKCVSCGSKETVVELDWLYERCRFETCPTGWMCDKVRRPF